MRLCLCLYAGGPVFFLRQNTAAAMAMLRAIARSFGVLTRDPAAGPARCRRRISERELCARLVFRASGPAWLSADGVATCGLATHSQRRRRNQNKRERTKLLRPRAIPNRCPCRRPDRIPALPARTASRNNKIAGDMFAVQKNQSRVAFPRSERYRARRSRETRSRHR